MTTSDYLEAFLTVYGWSMYYVFYLLFASIGLFLYPFLRILNDVYVGYVSGSEYAATNYLRQLIASILMATLVFFVALVPMKSIDLKSTTVKSMCAERKDVMDKRGVYFNNTETRVPIMPYLAMSIGHGISSVIYSSGKCAIDVTDAHKATMSADLSEAENPQLLSNELNRFVQECHSKAKSLLNQVMDNKNEITVTNNRTVNYAELNKYLENKVNNLVSRTGNKNKEDHRRYLLNNYDSPLLQHYFYAILVADNPVDNIVGAGNGSQRQGSKTPPTCGQWWTGSNGLRFRLVQAMSDSVAVNMANDMGHPSCQNDRPATKNNYQAYMSPQRKAECAAAVKASVFDNNQEQFVQKMFKSLQGGATDTTVNNSESNKIGIATAAAALSFIPGLRDLFGDVGQQALSQITGFYMTIFLLKVMLKYFVPMILMSVYMFWGFYMTVGEFRGMTMIKGMILIIVLTMMPSLWGIVEHLDDKLYGAMYYKGSGGIVDQILLDITTGIFQIAIVFILFYLVGEAGGGDARGAVTADQRMMNNAANGTGNKAGTGFGNTLFGQRDSKGNITSGGLVPKTWGGIKGGWNNLRK